MGLLERLGDGDRVGLLFFGLGDVSARSDCIKPSNPLNGSDGAFVNSGGILPLRGDPLRPGECGIGWGGFSVPSGDGLVADCHRKFRCGSSELAEG